MFHPTIILNGNSITTCLLLSTCDLRLPASVRKMGLLLSARSELYRSLVDESIYRCCTTDTLKDPFFIESLYCWKIVEGRHDTINLLSPCLLILCLRTSAKQPSTMSVGYNLFGCMSLLTYRQDPYDVVSAGNYQIYSCGKQAELVRALLEQTYNLLREASASLQDSDAVHGLVYRTFLDGVDKHELRRMLAQIMAGEHVSIFGKPPWFPVIACVNNDNPRLKEPYEFCAKNLETPAMWANQTTIILLCPSMLSSLVPMYPVASDCPSVVSGAHNFRQPC